MAQENQDPVVKTESGASCSVKSNGLTYLEQKEGEKLVEATLTGPNATQLRVRDPKDLLPGVVYQQTGGDGTVQIGRLTAGHKEVALGNSVASTILPSISNVNTLNAEKIALGVLENMGIRCIDLGKETVPAFTPKDIKNIAKAGNAKPGDSYPRHS